MRKKYDQTIKVLLAATIIASTVGTTHRKAEALTVHEVYAQAYNSTINALNVRTQKSINEARKAIESMRGTGAAWAIGEFSKQVDTVQHPFLVTIVDAITKAQKSISQADINVARGTIDPELPQVWKNSYSSALDLVQQSLIKQLIDACNTAEITKTPESKDKVNQLINELNTSLNPDITKWVAAYTKSVLEVLNNNGTPARLGNNTGNNNNMGSFVQKDGYIYTNSLDSGYIFRTKLDGSEKKMLNSHPSSYINVVDNYIFYINKQDGDKLYRMNTDGSNNVCLNKSDYVMNFVAYDGYIYYNNFSDGGRLYRLKFDGSGKTKISDDTHAQFINVYGNYLYYSAHGLRGGGGPIYRVNLDGSNKKLISNVEGSYIIVENDTIYFINTNDNNKLYKMNLDGTNAKKLNDDSCSFLNISSNVLYYKNSSDNGKIYAIKTDGTLRTPVTTEEAYLINIAGGKIYYKTDYDYGVTNSTSLLNLDKVEAPVSSSELGNLAGNINNEAFVASDGSYIYANEQGVIYRYNNDLTNRVYIGKDDTYRVNYLNALNGWVYYASMSENQILGNEKIYKIKADGSGQKIQLSSNRAFNITVAGDWIYYTTEEFYSNIAGGPIHKVRTDGTGETYVSMEHAKYLSVYEDYVYYANMEDNMTIYRIKTDGTGREKVLDEKATGLNVVGGYIYYNSTNYYGDLKRVKISGGTSELLKSNVENNHIVTNDKIYYVKGQSIYSINHDGTSETLVTNCYSSEINIAGDYLYYKGDGGRTQTLKIK